MALQKINLGATVGDKTGDGARTAGAKINANFDYLEDKIENRNKVVFNAGLTQDGNEILINAGWQWLINGVLYTNPVAVLIDVPVAAAGLSRIDNIVATTSNTFSRSEGTESETPVAPIFVPGTIVVAFVLVNDTALQDSGNVDPEKLDRAGYNGTAATLDQKIDGTREDLMTRIDNLIEEIDLSTVDAIKSGLNEAIKNSDIKFNYIQQNVKNPILSVSASGWDTKFREIGNVIKVNGRYVLVYSGFTGTYTETSAVYCGIATSTDGVNWVKGGINNDGLAYTDVFNEDNYIVYNNGTYYIYSENKSTIPQTISLHTSTDLVNFTNMGNVLTNSVSGFDRGDVSSPTVFIENGVWKMIYEGRDFTGSVVDNGKIGIATSNDGINWTKSPTPIISTTLINGFWAAESIVPDDIVKIGDTYYLSYHGRAFNADIYRCGMAYSQDLVNWKDYFGSPILKDGGNTQDNMFLFDGGLDVVYYSTDRESILRAKLANKSFNYWSQSGADIENSNSGDVIVKKALKLTRNDGGNALLISNGVDTDLLVNTTPVGAGNKYVGFSSTVPNRAIVLNEGNGGFIGIGKIPTERLDVNGNVKANTFIGSAELTGVPTAPTATAGSANNQIANTAFVQQNARPYKVYTALLTQSGTNAPVATVLENTLGTLVFGYNSTGNYTITSLDLFTNNKTVTFIGGNSTGVPTTFKLQRTSDSNIDMFCYNGAGASNGLFNTSIEIRVYN